MARSRDLDRVYAAAPADFVRTRNAVAKELADSGRAKDAAAVRRLRRPTLAVWILNQLARQEPGSVAAFVKAVESLGKAQRTGAGVAEAIKAERQARQRVIAQAEALAATAGVRTTADTTRRIANTFLGAATDRDARDLLARGELQDETQPSGFEQFAGVTLRAVKPARPAASLQREARIEKTARDLERTARQQRNAAAETARRKARLERDLRALEVAARDAERAAEGANARASEAREKLRALQDRQRRPSDDR